VASTYYSLNYHVIFATKGRAPVIGGSWRGDLHAYIGGTVRQLEGRALIVGGVADHVHILASLKTNMCVADVVREVKKASSVWASERYENFGWQVGYAAFTVSPPGIEDLSRYIANQEEHHRHLSSSDELLALLKEFEIEYNPMYFE